MKMLPITLKRDMSTTTWLGILIRTSTMILLQAVTFLLNCLTISMESYVANRSNLELFCEDYARVCTSLDIIVKAPTRVVFELKKISNRLPGISISSIYRYTIFI